MLFMNSTLLHSNTTSNKPAFRFLVTAFFLALLIIGNSDKINAQVSANYTFTESAINPVYSVLDVNTKTQIFTGAWNDQTPVSVPIGFSFTFNGSPYTTAFVSPNGYITFGVAPTATNYSPLSTTGTYTGAIAGYASNLSVGTIVGSPQLNSVSRQTIGAVGSRIFKVEYNDFRKNSGESTVMGFQIWLHETTNVIEIHYKDTSGTFAVNTTGQVGLRGVDVNDFNIRFWNPASGIGWPEATPTTAALTNTATTNYVRTRNLTGIASTSNRTFRWTPSTCLTPASLAVTVGSETTVGATITWSGTAAGGFQYSASTINGTPSGPTGTTPSGTSQVIGGLSSGTQYYVYVRSDCGGGVYSPWIGPQTFTTLCSAQNTPYLEYAETGYTIPALPPCMTKQVVSGTHTWATETASFTDGFDDKHLVCAYVSGPAAANAWVYTKGVNMVAGEVYRLSYLYGGSTNATFITNKMQVAYGTSPTAASMTTTLANHPNIKYGATTNVVNFTAPSSGVFYFGFKSYSAANQGKLFLDNIEITHPGCRKPSAVTVYNITGSSALLTWTAPSPAPGSGYAYYLSTSATPPSNDQNPTGFTSVGTTLVNLTGLTGSTNYYFWVRSVCGPNGDMSEWEQLIVPAMPSPLPYFTTLVQPVYTYCTPAPLSVDSSGIINVTFGTINNSTGDEPGHYGNYSNLSTDVIQGALVPVSIRSNTYDWFFGPIPYVIKIWVDWNNDSDFYDTGENVYTGTTIASAPNTLLANFTVPPGAILGEHRLRIGGADADFTDLTGTGAGEGPCYDEDYGSFEDYTINVKVQPPVLTIDLASSVQCANVNSPTVHLTSAPGNYNTYNWSPAGGISGDITSGFVFNTNTTTTYVLTGTQTVFPFSTNTVNFTYYANPRPTPITITPTTATTCQNGPAVLLTATGGVVSNIPVFSEDFNGSAPGWVTDNVGSTGIVANGDWTIQPDGYTPGNSWDGNFTIHSNDATSFYFSDSDAQGLGSHTETTLVSPPFSLAGYTNASVSFWHYFKEWTNGGAYVEISLNGQAGPFASLQSFTHTGTTSSVGEHDDFENTIVDLNPYLGEANVCIRFRLSVNWGFGWAIDNFVILGSATSDITWSPSGIGSGLYTNALATTVYNGGPTNTVYALPSATATFTASASTPSPTICTTTATAAITINPIVAGVVSPSTQSTCTGMAADLVRTPGVGNVTKWQYANDLLFTAGITDIAVASNTLTSLQIGTLTGTRYFRAVITNGPCTAYSNIVTITVPTTTWNGTAWSAGPPNSTTVAIIAGNYSPLTDISACSFVVNSGVVTIASNTTLTVQNAVMVNGGSLTFNDSASLYQISDAAVNTGNIIYRRNTTPMKTYDFTYWSSPVFPQTLVNLSPLTMADKYFWWNAAPAVYNWESIAAPGITNMMPGRGYIIRAPQGWPAIAQPYPATFTGVPNNGLVNIPVIINGTKDLNLIGNPYPSALNADAFLSTTGPNGSILGGTIYLWTHNTPIDPLQYTGTDYAVYNLVGGVGTGTPGGGTGNTSVPTGKIASGEGFFVKAINTGGNVTFNNSMRVAGNNSQFYRLANSSTFEKNRIWLDIRNAQGAYKQTLVGYIETATNDRDRDFDGDAVEAGNIVALYTILNTEKLSIQGRALPFDANDQVPIGYKSGIPGNFTITMPNFDGLFLTQNVYLEDKLLNVIHNLKGSDYAFTTEAGTFDNRFVLRYTDGMLGVNPSVFNENSVVVYKNESGIHINTSGITMESVKIFDMRGRLILVKDGINDNETVITNINTGEQVLLVQVTSTDSGTVTKKIVY